MGLFDGVKNFMGGASMVKIEPTQIERFRAMITSIDPEGYAGCCEAIGAMDLLPELHRIEESAVRAEVERAGFKLASEGNFLRNPQDTRDWNDSPKAAAERRGTSDRFALLFVKPQ